MSSGPWTVVHEGHRWLVELGDCTNDVRLYLDGDFACEDDKHDYCQRIAAVLNQPKSCPTCEALARTVMADQVYHDKVCPAREPLTVEQRTALRYRYQDGSLRTIDDLIRAVEQVHGIGGEE